MQTKLLADANMDISSIYGTKTNVLWTEITSALEG